MVKRVLKSSRLRKNVKGGSGEKSGGVNGN
jgi:hypothetical protein